MSANNPQWYNQPGSAGPARTNSNAVIGFILSLVSFFTLGIILAIPGLILSRRAQAEIAASGEQGEGLAKAGVILGWISIILTIVGVVIAIIVIVLSFAVSGSIADQGNAISSCIAQGTNTCN